MTNTLRANRTGAGDVVSYPSRSDPQFDLVADFRAELDQLSANQRDLLEELRSDGVIDLDAEEAPLLQRENAALRTRVKELERLLNAAPGSDDVWAERQQDYEKLLEEKSETIRTLHMKLQGATAAAAPVAPAPAEARDATIERLRRELEEQRAQLLEDEEALQQQLRMMEMTMAKDRADLARLRADLQRQQADFAREVEVASRDPQLREQLASLRRHQQEHYTKKPAEAPAAISAPTSNKGSGLMRRLFG